MGEILDLAIYWLDVIFDSVRHLAPHILSVLLGLIFYYWRRDISITRERYLDNCIESIASNYENMFRIYRHNFSSCLSAVAEYKRDGALIPNKSYDVTRYEMIVHGTFKITDMYRIDELTNSDKLGDIIQVTTVSITHIANNMVEHVCRCIKKLVELERQHEGDVNTDFSQKEVTKLFKYISDQNEEIDKFHIVLRRVHDLSEIFSKEMYIVKTLNKFSQRSDVIKIIEELDSYFGQKVTKVKNTTVENLTRPTH